MKFAYLDEAGISGEPWVVVAGLLIDPDMQWAGLRRYLDDMAAHYLLPEDRGGYVFHATEIFSGNRRFDKRRYSLDVRKKIMHDLCALPENCGARVVVGAVDLLKFQGTQGNKTKKQIISDAHCIAYANCVCNIDYFMANHTDDEEMATLIVENNPDARRHIKETHKYLGRPELAESLSDHRMGRFLPITRIVDVPHFVDKADSPIMQIADVCAFVIMRKLCGLSHVDEYFDLLLPHIFEAPPDDGGTNPDPSASGEDAGRPC